MCQYWYKMHTCTHASDRPYIEMCRPGYLSNTVCQDIATDPQHRRSHFPCYMCIKQDAHAEAQAKRDTMHASVLAAKNAREQAARQKAEDEKKAREERVRREAREKAERERIAEQRLRSEREREAEQVQREGGRWMLAEAGSGKKKRGKGVVAASPSSLTSLMSSVSLGGSTTSGGSKASGALTASGITVRLGNSTTLGGTTSAGTASAGTASPQGLAKKAWKENDRGAESSGRAGTWGPKKILSRKEGAAALAMVMDGINGAGGAKK